MNFLSKKLGPNDQKDCLDLVDIKTISMKPTNQSKDIYGMHCPFRMVSY